MSNFNCETCGQIQWDDGSRGYVQGCGHHPPEHNRFVWCYFGGNVPPVQAFYKGGFYKSEKSRRAGKSIHPVLWSMDKLEQCQCGELEPGNLTGCASPGCFNQGCDSCESVEWCCDDHDEANGDWFCDQCR